MNPALQRDCHTVLPGHRARSPSAMFADMSAWCAEHDIAHDVYGCGEAIEAFEHKVAKLLGFERAVFCITGTMAQVTALRLACEGSGSNLVALHPTSHIIVHERSNYQLLGHFNALQAGDRHRPWTVSDLAAIPDRLGAVAMEVPMREIGGQNPSWDEIQAIKAHCRERKVHLHMDGARLWECAEALDKAPREIAAGFDSVYVSMYKGIGGLGGAMLLGDAAFIERAAEWFRREGGNVIHRTPYVVAAAMQFDARMAAMPACFKRTQWLYSVLADFPSIRVNPAAPQANMLHLHLPVTRERALELRDTLAREHGIWMFSRASHAALPDTSYVELYVGDNLLDMPDDTVRHAFALFTQEMGG